MAIFRDPDPDAQAVIDKVTKTWHNQLFVHGVTVGCIFAYAAGEDEDADALKHHGYPANAIIKINSLEDRVQGKADCTIKVDGRKWQAADDAWKLALIDHELTHIELVMNAKTRRPKTDDAGRPRLKMRVHDFENGGFDEVISRHKAEAIEYQNHVEINRRFQQREFSWG